MNKSNLKFWLAAVVAALLITAVLELLKISQVQQDEYPFENHSEITQETLEGKN